MLLDLLSVSVSHCLAEEREEEENEATRGGGEERGDGIKSFTNETNPENKYDDEEVKRHSMKKQMERGIIGIESGEIW